MEKNTQPAPIFTYIACSLFCLFLLHGCQQPAQQQESQPETGEIYHYQPQTDTRWSSFENPEAAKGAGGKENKGAKGRAFERWAAGEVKTLLDVEGSGTVDRIWLTVPERDTATLHTLRLKMYWDGEAAPAVDVPLGDFFGNVWGKTTAFETAFFANPEGRSFVSYVPMPFQKQARITLTNTTGRDLSHIFYDVNFTLKPIGEEALYFHAIFRESNNTPVGEDYEILPKLEGKGKFLGAHIGVRTDPAYENTWWGEGEVKIYLDGDGELPTLNGTGTEDYIGTGWGQGSYVNRYQGCWVADGEDRLYTFYRYHVPDPVFFHQDCRVTIQQIGGGQKELVISLQEKGVALNPISIDETKPDGSRGEFIKLLEKEPQVALNDPSLPNGWTNFYRSDHWTSIAFCYLDSPVR